MSILDLPVETYHFVKSILASRQAAKAADAANEATTAYANKSAGQLQRIHNSKKGPKHYQTFLRDLDHALNEFERTGDYNALYSFLTKDVPGNDAAKLAALNKWLGTTYRNFNDFIIDPKTLTRRDAAYFRNRIRPVAEQDLKRSQDWYDNLANASKKKYDQYNADYLAKQQAADAARNTQSQAGKRLAKDGAKYGGAGLLGAATIGALTSSEDPAVISPNAAPVNSAENADDDIGFWERLGNMLDFGQGDLISNIHKANKALIGNIIKSSLPARTVPVNTPVAAPPVSAPPVASAPAQTAPLVPNSPALLPDNTVAVADTPSQTSSLPVSDVPAENPVVEDIPQKPAATIRKIAPAVKTARRMPIANTPTETDLASAMVKHVISPQVLQYGSPYYLQQQQQNSNPTDMRQWVRQKYGMSMSPAEMVQRGIMPRDYLQYW